MRKKFMYNARLLATVAAGSLLACSFATSFDDLEGADPSPANGVNDASGDRDEKPSETSDATTEGDSAVPLPEYFPPEGDYAYEASGEESLNFNNGGYALKRNEGTSASVRLKRAGDQWTFTLTTAGGQHKSEYVFEARSNTLSEVSMRHWESWQFPDGIFSPTYQEHAVDWTCSPTNALLIHNPTDASLAHTCTGSVSLSGGYVGSVKITASGAYRYVGKEQLTVGEEAVEVAHFSQTRLLGNLLNDSRFDAEWYFRTTDGLPIKQTREVRTEQLVGIIPVVYTETAEWHAVSLVPTDGRSDAGNDAGVSDSGPADSGIKDAAKGQ